MYWWKNDAPATQKFDPEKTQTEKSKINEMNYFKCTIQRTFLPVVLRRSDWCRITKTWSRPKTNTNTQTDSREEKKNKQNYR